MEGIPWEDAVAYLGTPAGIGVVVGILISIIVEYIPAYEQLATKWKRVVYLALCLLVPAAGVLLGWLTLGWDITNWYATWWPAIVAGASAFLGGTALHIKIHGTPEGAKLRKQ